MGWNDRGHLFVGGSGEYSWGSNDEMHRQGSTKHVEDTGGLEAAYEFGRSVYAEEPLDQQLVEALSLIHIYIKLAISLTTPACGHQRGPTTKSSPIYNHI